MFVYPVSHFVFNGSTAFFSFPEVHCDLTKAPFSLIDSSGSRFVVRSAFGFAMHARGYASPFLCIATSCTSHTNVDCGFSSSSPPTRRLFCTLPDASLSSHSSSPYFKVVATDRACSSRFNFLSFRPPP